MEKNEIIHILREAEPLLEKMAPNYEEIKKLQSQAPQYIDPEVAAKKKPIGRYMFLALAVLFLMSGVFDFIRNGFDWDFNDLAPFIFVCVIFIRTISSVLKAPAKNRMSAEKNNQKREEILAEVEIKTSEFKELLAQIQATGISDVLTGDYQTVEHVHLIRKYLENGRADTVKEALNVLEEEMHRYRMEEEAKNATKAAQDAANAARWTAAGTWADYLKK